MFKRFSIIGKHKDGSLKTYMPEFQTDPKLFQAWLSVLKKAHRKLIFLYCNCPSSYSYEQKPLYVAYYRNFDEYVVKSYPNTKHFHHENCFFRRNAIRVSISFKVHTSTKRPLDSLIQTNTNFVILKPEIGIQVRSTPKKTDPLKDKVSRPQDPYKKYSSSTSPDKLSRFLHVLWELGKLNTWKPGEKRSLDYLNSQIKKASNRILVSKRLSLKRLLILPCTNNESEEYHHNIKVIKYCMQTKKRPFVLNFFPDFADDNPYVISFLNTLGITKKVETSSTENSLYKHENVILPTRFYTAVPFLYLPKEYFSVVKKVFKKLASMYLKKECLICYLAHIDVPKVVGNEGEEVKYASTVLNVTFMAVSDAFIPIESQYEAQFESLLRKLGKSFKKPFISPNFSLVPDFIVFEKDSSPIYVEIFGMHTKEYLARKEEKLRFYKNKNIKVLTWDPIAEPDKLKSLSF